MDDGLKAIRLSMWYQLDDKGKLGWVSHDLRSSVVSTYAHVAIVTDQSPDPRIKVVASLLKEK